MYLFIVSVKCIVCNMPLTQLLGIAEQFIMPPTSKKLRRHIGLALSICPSVCPSVRPSVRLSVTLAPGQKPLEIGSLNLVCGWSMKIKETRNFFLVHRICHYSVIALFKVFHFHYIVSLWKLVNKISQEPLEPGSRYLDHRLCLRCR